MTRAPGAAGTPFDDGFYFPADDCRHAQMWLPWPREPALRAAVANVAKIVMRYEPVALVVAPGDEESARRACVGASIAALPLDALRLRDVGPSFLVDGKGGAAAADMRFNGWGERYAAGRDATFAHELLGAIEVRRFRTPLTLEGSAFVVDGAGTALVLAQAVFDLARNPGLTPLDGFAMLQKWLGVTRVVWVGRGLPGDTHAADVRALVNFLAPGVVAVSSVPGDHPHADVLKDTRAALQQAKDASGGPFTLVDLRAPDPVFRAGRALPLAYTNFLAVNGAILVPMFGTGTDESALDVLARSFPGRAIEPVPAMIFADHETSLTALALPQPARLLQRDRATTLPRSAWSQPAPDVETLLQKYVDMAEKD